MQSICNTYPSPYKLHQWGLWPTPDCPACKGREHPSMGTQGHIQGCCDGTKEARIKAHHTLRKVVSDAIHKQC